MLQFFEHEKGKNFVAGLVWQAFPGTSSHQNSEVKKLSRELDVDMVVWRKSSVLQAGLGSSAEGIKKGYFSAAAIVSKSIEVETGARNFLAAVRLSSDRYLYVAQREGAIVPQGDFIGTEDEVKVRLLQDRSIGEIEVIVCPEMWGIQYSTERDFSSFLQRDKKGNFTYNKWSQMHPVNGDALRKMIVIGVAVVIVLGAAYGHKEYKRIKHEEELARLAALEASTGSQVKLEHPWKTQGNASMVVRNCVSAFLTVPDLSPGNWDFSAVGCSNGSMVISWKRGTAWIEHLLRDLPSAMVSQDGTSASYNSSYTTNDGAEDEEVKSLREADIHFMLASQKLGIEISRAAKNTVPQVLPGDTPNKPQGYKDWAELSWEAKDFQLSPVTVIDVLQFPGIRVDQVMASYNNGTLKWTMKGTQYVQP